MNQISVIHPYRTKHGSWVFDDESRGLKGEALVANTPTVIGLACQEFSVKDPQNGFTVLFSYETFQGCQFSCKWVEGDRTGNTYLYDRNGRKEKFWLCPALFLYIDDAPKELFIRVEELPK